MSDVLLAALMAQNPAAHPEELVERACKLTFMLAEKHNEMHAARIAARRGEALSDQHRWAASMVHGTELAAPVFVTEDAAGKVIATAQVVPPQPASASEDE